MEKYRDSVIPPLTDLVLPARLGISNAIEMDSSSRNRGKIPAAAASNYGDTESIQKERTRREKMAENYSLLQSIVPNLLPKVNSPIFNIYANLCKINFH